MKRKYKVAVTDDHSLLRRALQKLINSFDQFTVTMEADTGLDLVNKIQKTSARNLPEILVLDVNMPDMDGYETVRWMTKNHPDIKVLALSMFSDENTILRMIKLGSRGYILKNIDPEELQTALLSLIEKDFYISQYIAGQIFSGRSIEKETLLARKSTYNSEKELLDSLKENEKIFITLVCTDKSYKEIADQMKLSFKTVDSYRIRLFEKLNVKTRVGLALFAMRNGLID